MQLLQREWKRSSSQNTGVVDSRNFPLISRVVSVTAISGPVSVCRGVILILNLSSSSPVELLGEEFLIFAQLAGASPLRIL